MRIEIRRQFVSSRELEPEEILRLVFGLREIEITTYQIISVSKGKPLDVEEVARKIDRDRTTAQRSLCNLVSAGLVVRRQEPHHRLFYRYEAISPEEMKEAMRAYIRALFEQMNKTIDEL
jgi:predicted transcriptional regulator